MLPPPPGRYLALDGLRGVAALLVLIFHAFWNTADSQWTRDHLIEPITVGTGFMRSGVAVFFVISGFVIAYTTRRLHDADGAWRFIARRQIRLDPPYYAMIVVALLIEGAQRLIPGLVYQSFDVGVVVLNMLYLQDIVGVPSVLAVAWTLCLEVQFYLLVVLVALTAGRIGRTSAIRMRMQIGVMLGLTAASLLLSLLGVSTGPWVLGTFWMFGAGMVLAWFVAGVIRLWLVGTVLGVLVVWGIAMSLVKGADPWGGHWFAIATALLVAVLAIGGWLARSPGRVMLYFGRISYSLYLAHLPVLIVVTGVLLKVLPDSLPARLLGILIGIAASIATAHLLHRFVEARAIQWSKRIPPTRPSPTGQPESVEAR